MLENKIKLKLKKLEDAGGNGNIKASAGNYKLESGVPGNYRKRSISNKNNFRFSCVGSLPMATIAEYDKTKKKSIQIRSESIGDLDKTDSVSLNQVGNQFKARLEMYQNDNFLKEKDLESPIRRLSIMNDIIQDKSKSPKRVLKLADKDQNLDQKIQKTKGTGLTHKNVISREKMLDKYISKVEHKKKVEELELAIKRLNDEYSQQSEVTRLMAKITEFEELGDNLQGTDFFFDREVDAKLFDETINICYSVKVRLESYISRIIDYCSKSLIFLNENFDNRSAPGPVSLENLDIDKNDNGDKNPHDQTKKIIDQILKKNDKKSPQQKISRKKFQFNEIINQQSIRCPSRDNVFISLKKIRKGI